jgi:hypothetical protein
MRGVRFGSIALAGLGSLAVPGVAWAALNAYLPPNYTFPDGVIGFQLSTSGGPVNPGVLVGFNPQPDPPGTPEPLLDFANRFSPLVVQTADGSVFKFELSFTGLEAGLLLPAVQKPDVDGKTEFQFRLPDGTVFVADLTFSGPGGVSSWVSFNPQPDPPGSPLGYFVGFGADASVALQLSENGVPLSFMVPEPSTWALMGLGFATLGLLAYRKASRTLTSGSQL